MKKDKVIRILKWEDRIEEWLEIRWWTFIQQEPPVRWLKRVCCEDGNWVLRTVFLKEFLTWQIKKDKKKIKKNILIL